MKLAAIYNIFDGVELLRGSIDCLKDHVDVIIIVWQDVSNYGEYFDPIANTDLSGLKHVVLVKYNPIVGAGMYNEKEKRILGLNIAREKGCTHFLHIDCDEYYEDFGSAKELFLQSGKAGSVCNLYTYFKEPTLRFDSLDGYFVPIIHKLNPDTQV